MCGQTDARSLSPSEALARALNSGNVSGALRTPVRAVPLMTVGSQEQPAIYVFDQGKEGYIMVSADDVAAPVLAYSDSGTFDPDNMPESLRWWLDEYKAQIEAATRENNEAYEKISRATREAIAPLLTTTWDQGTPFNNDCPLINGQQTVSGCVATAMAQVMNYHKWPESFNANFSYDWQAGETKLSWKQTDVKFNWKNMIDSYRGKYQPLEGTAVATLMKACGYSVQMNYNISAVGGSAASSLFIPEALVKHFKYDKGIYTAMRTYYSLNEWEDLIYNELLNNRPVIYSGGNDYSGHCFVCDGYKGDGFFHFNWGWSGVSDGYFLLTALNPEVQGIGGSTSGFNDNQDIVLGIQKSIATSPMTVIMVCDDLLSGTGGTNSLTITAIKESNAGFFNLSNGIIIGKYGVRFVDDKGNVAMTLYLNEDVSLKSLSGIKEFTIRTTNFPKGKYKIYPVFKTSAGDVVRIKIRADQPGYLDYERTGNNITVTTPEAGKYSVTDLKMETPMYKDNKFLASGKAVWTGPNSVNTPVYGVLMTGTTAETIIAIGETMPQEFLPDGTPSEFQYMSEWIKVVDKYVNTGIPAGDYYFAMAIKWGDSYKLLSSPISVTMLRQTGSTKMQVSNLVIADKDAVDPDNLTLSFNASCRSGYFMSYYVVAVFSPSQLYAVAQFNTQVESISIGEVKTFKAKGAIPQAKPGEKYLVKIYNGWNMQPTSLSAEIIIGDKSGIGDVIADGGNRVTASPNPATDRSVITATDEILRVDLVSLSGTQLSVPTDINGLSATIDVSAIPAGLYIARISTASGVETVKIVKK